jgi:hypothetical protein
MLALAVSCCRRVCVCTAVGKNQPHLQPLVELAACKLAVNAAVTSALASTGPVLLVAALTSEQQKKQVEEGKTGKLRLQRPAERLGR